MQNAVIDILHFEQEGKVGTNNALFSLIWVGWLNTEIFTIDRLKPLIILQFITKVYITRPNQCSFGAIAIINIKFNKMLKYKIKNA